MCVRYAGEVVNNATCVSAASAHTRFSSDTAVLYLEYECHWEYSILYISIFEKNNLKKIILPPLFLEICTPVATLLLPLHLKLQNWFIQSCRSALESVFKHLILVQQVRVYEYRQTKTLFGGEVSSAWKEDTCWKWMLRFIHTCQSRAVLGSVVL